MLVAYNQADQYIRALPANEGRPPFIVVTDVGRSIALYSEFTGTGGTYVPFPDPGHHRIRLADLAKPAIQQRLQRLWLAPDSLDPSKYAAQVTREVSLKLAELAKSLEAQGFAVERVAHCLKRCLFTMFSEDVGLIPEASFTKLLERLKSQPEYFANSMGALWQTMNNGGFEGQLLQKLPRFNGGLFIDIDPIPLDSEQIQLLIDAAKADWRYVEPAIVGTLLERALDPREHHKLGAHFTPRAYVERLVMPTIINPLREQWSTVQVAAETWLQQDKADKALNELQLFHHHLCEIRILDPACGSGNFLYVALEHLKRLEGEVLNMIADLTDGQIRIETQGLTVDPHQFLGLEINPRAAAIAELVLWIGYLQWHYRIHGKLDLPEPILRDFHNIEHRDALLDYDGREVQLDEAGKPLTIWDGLSYKTSPVTGELIPDDSQRISVYSYRNPTAAQWPQADYIVGNPPFIGEKRMREALGDGYTEAVRAIYKELPACDFVMYWWHKAAELVTTTSIRQFGFITTNSIGQSKNRAVVEPYLDGEVALTFAIPDHPWVDSTDGAAVRIAMTVGGRGSRAGELLQLRSERNTGSETTKLEFESSHGEVFADLTVGAALVDARPLVANDGLVFQGVKLVGSGFLVSPAQRATWVAEKPEWDTFLPHLIAGSDLTKRRESRYCIDFYGLEEDDAQRDFPPCFQKVLDEVKPFREQVKRKAHRDRYWLYGEVRPGMRSALRGLSRYVATSEVSKHRYFVLLDSTGTLADGSLAVVTIDDLFYFGILSSRVHIRWAFAQGGTLEDRPRWQNGQCFLNFPFPELIKEGQAVRIRDLAERLDAHRKTQQAAYPDLTLRGMYNVLEKLRSGEALSPKEQIIHQQGLVSVLRELHDELDRAVFAAYGWDDLADKLVGLPGATTSLPDKPAEQAAAEEELLMRLVALNSQRAAEEAQGHIRWLRPEYQAPDATQTSAELLASDTSAAPTTVPAAARKLTWPKQLREQITTLLDLMQQGTNTAEQLAAQFKRKPVKAVTQVLSALESLGRAHCVGEHWSLG